MSDLESRLHSFGMGQYFPSFMEAGFESWETILDITEDDLDSLGVQRGHRRRLQQQIAYSLSLRAALEDQPSGALNSQPKADTSLGAGTGRKRRYTRHPKPDPKAPQRPPTAYVLFSNALREEIKDQPLSFVEKSKIAGDRWDKMSESERSQWRQKAAGPWEKYKHDRMRYQSTDDYRDYQAYLDKFHASQPSKRRMTTSSNIPKVVDDAEPRPKLEHLSPTDAEPSFVASHVSPAPASSKNATKSMSLPLPDRKEKLASHRGDPCSTTAMPTRGKSAQAFSHACESCRKKKVKCDGAVPSCERCLRTSTACIYEGGIRDQEKR